MTQARPRLRRRPRDLREHRHPARLRRVPHAPRLRPAHGGRRMRAVFVGGSSGIGLAAARRAAAAGWDVVDRQPRPGAGRPRRRAGHARHRRRGGRPRDVRCARADRPPRLLSRRAGGRPRPVARPRCGAAGLRDEAVGAVRRGPGRRRARVDRLRLGCRGDDADARRLGDGGRERRNRGARAHPRRRARARARERRLAGDRRNTHLGRDGRRGSRGDVRPARGRASCRARRHGRRRSAEAIWLLLTNGFVTGTVLARRRRPPARRPLTDARDPGRRRR